MISNTKAPIKPSAPYELLPTLSTLLDRCWNPSPSLAGARSLIRLIEVAHRERMEIDPMIVGLAYESRGVFRRNLFRLASRLSEGTPLVAALEQTPGVLKEEAVLAIRFGVQTGTLGATLRRLKEDSDSTDASKTGFHHASIYFAVVIVCLACVTAFLHLKVLPIVFRLGSEFGYASNRINTGKFDNLWGYRTLGLVDSHLMSSLWFWILGSIFLAAIAMKLIRGSLGPKLSKSSIFRFGREMRSAQLLRLLAVALESGRPLPGSLSTLARYHFDPKTRAKLLFVRNEVEQGADLWNSLSDAGFITRLESKAFVDSSSNANRAWLMRRLAEWKEARIDRIFVGMTTWIQPALLLILGAYVLWIGIAIFGFMSYLIQSLA